MDTKNLPQAKIDEDNLGITAFLNKEAVKQQVAHPRKITICIQKRTTTK